MPLLAGTDPVVAGRFRRARRNPGTLAAALSRRGFHDSVPELRGHLDELESGIPRTPRRLALGNRTNDGRLPGAVTSGEWNLGRPHQYRATAANSGNRLEHGRQRRHDHRPDRIHGPQGRFALADRQAIQHQRGPDHEAKRPNQRRAGGQPGSPDNSRQLKLNRLMKLAVAFLRCQLQNPFSAVSYISIGLLASKRAGDEKQNTKVHGFTSYERSA